MCLQQEERDLLSAILMARIHRALPRVRMKEKKSVMRFREGGRELAAIASGISGGYWESRFDRFLLRTGF
jgi:hypothetical protein